VPDGAAPERGWPLLVLMHRDGRSKETEARGAWAEFARAERVALLVPAARYAAHEDPRAGGAWLSDVEDLVRRPWRSVEPALDDVRRVIEGRAIDRARVVAVGEGTGAPVAFDAACRASGLFRAAVLVEGAIHAEAALTTAPAAALLGLEVVALVGADAHADARAALLASALERLGHGPGSAAVRRAPAAELDASARAAVRAALGP
jgi:predicted esterase